MWSKNNCTFLFSKVKLFKLSQISTIRRRKCLLVCQSVFVRPLRLRPPTCALSGPNMKLHIAPSIRAPTAILLLFTYGESSLLLNQSPPLSSPLPSGSLPATDRDGHALRPTIRAASGARACARLLSLSHDSRAQIWSGPVLPVPPRSRHAHPRRRASPRATNLVRCSRIHVASPSYHILRTCAPQNEYHVISRSSTRDKLDDGQGIRV